VHYHKIVLSPADDEPIENWREWTRDVMSDLEEMQGKELHWYAVSHQNTEHPHIHVVLAGAGEDPETGEQEPVKLYQEDYQRLRREHRLVHLPEEEVTSVYRHEGDACIQMEEEATKNVYDEWLVLQLAREIALLPCKQRRAILIDLANRTCFDDQPTPLQYAFLAVGIDLQTFQLQLPGDRVERSRHSSLASHAYRRISELYREQLLMSVA
jgi:hypothetical protein